jgi:hypothetical protein
MDSEASGSPTRGEDYLRERKTKNDLKDLLKTMVAFANSVRPGHVASILIGERDDGTPEGLSALEADNIQKRVRSEGEKIYPPIIWRSEVYGNAGKQCVRVEIEHSGDTPHFGGPAWVRRGSVTVLASEQEFQRLVDIRSSAVREIDQWLGKAITVETLTTYQTGAVGQDTGQVTVKFVNQFFVTLEQEGGRFISYPHKQLTLSWDDRQKRLKLILEQTAVRPT